MDTTTFDFVNAGTLAELKTKGRLVVHGRHRPILVLYEDGHVFALDNRCPHMGFPLERGSIDDGILTCHWHHARFELTSGCTFDLWADDVPTFRSRSEQAARSESNRCSAIPIRSSIGTSASKTRIAVRTFFSSVPSRNPASTSFWRAARIFLLYQREGAIGRARTRREPVVTAAAPGCGR